MLQCDHNAANLLSVTTGAGEVTNQQCTPRQTSADFHSSVWPCTGCNLFLFTTVSLVAKGLSDSLPQGNVLHSHVVQKGNNSPLSRCRGPWVLVSMHREAGLCRQFLKLSRMGTSHSGCASKSCCMCGATCAISLTAGCVCTIPITNSFFLACQL